MGVCTSSILVFFVRFKVVKTTVAAQVIANKVSIDRVGIVANVDIEGNIAYFAGVLGACVANFVSEPEVGSVGRVYSSSGAPGLAAGEGFADGNLLSIGVGVIDDLSYGCFL